MSAQASCPYFSSFIDCQQQYLVSPSRVTPINAEKFWCELYFHPDQIQILGWVAPRMGYFSRSRNPFWSFIRSYRFTICTYLHIAYETNKVERLD